jgi:hypothetical protein
MRPAVLLTVLLLGVPTILSEPTIHDEFPIQIEESEYAKWSYDKLSRLGFDTLNTIPIVGLCRDELTGTFLNAISNVWSYHGHGYDTVAFITHSLAGMVVMGKTGIGAAQGHSPQDKDGKKHYVYYAFTHIGFNHTGHPGSVKRFGIEKESEACGALFALHAELESGNVNIAVANDDEENNLKKRLKDYPGVGHNTSISSLTKAAHSAIYEDLENLIKLTPDCRNPTSKCDYAVFTGVQLNGGVEGNSIWPGHAYAVVNGIQTNFTIDSSKHH